MSTQCLSSFGSLRFIFLRLPFCLSCFHSSSSSLNQTVTGGGSALHFNASLLSSFLHSLSFPVLHQMDRVPRGSPWISCFRAWSKTTWPLETMWIFHASETLWRAGIYLQGCRCRARVSAHSHIHTDNMQSQASRQIGLSCGNNMLSYRFSHQCLWLQSPISTWNMTWLCLLFCRSEFCRVSW